MNEHLLNKWDDGYCDREPLRNISDAIYNNGVATFTERDINYGILLDRMLKNCLLHADVENEQIIPTLMMIICVTFSIIFIIFNMPSYVVATLIGCGVIIILNYLFYFGGWWYKLRMWSKINKSFEIIKSNLKKANMLIIPTSDYTGYYDNPDIDAKKDFIMFCFNVLGECSKIKQIISDNEFYIINTQWTNIYLKFDLEHKSLQSTLRRYIDYVGMVDEYTGYNYLLDDYNNNDLLNKLYNRHPKLELAKKLKHVLSWPVLDMTGICGDGTTKLAYTYISVQHQKETPYSKEIIKHKVLKMGEDINIINHNKIEIIEPTSHGTIRYLETTRV